MRTGVRSAAVRVRHGRGGDAVTSGAATTIEVQPWRPLQRLARLVGPALVLVSAVMLAVMHDVMGLVDVTIFLVGYVTINAIVFTIGLGSQRRAQQRLMAASPPGTVFAVSATVAGQGQATSSGRAGVLLIDQLGLRFTPKKVGVEPTVLPWAEVRSLSIGPSRRSPFAAGVVASTGSAELRWWTPCGKELSAAMERHRAAQHWQLAPE